MSSTSMQYKSEETAIVIHLAWNKKKKLEEENKVHVD